MNSKALIIGVIALILIGGGIYLASSQSAQKDTSMMTNTTPTNSPETATPETAMDATMSFTVEGSNYAFAPNTLSVKKGDKVKVTFKNTGGFHDFKIDEFNVATKQLKDGAEETVEFTADKAGTFEYYCSVGKHRQMGMVGKLTVTE